MKPKPSIAIIIPGGIGTGQYNIGVPVLERLVLLLAADFEITVFSMFPANDGYLPHGFDLVNIKAPNRLLTVLRVISTFHKHHRIKKFSVAHGFWTMPSGLIAVLIGWMYNIKSIVSIMGGDAVSLPEIKYGQFQRPIHRKLILWTLRNADQVLATPYMVKTLDIAGLNRSDVKTIHFGVDNSLFTLKEKPLSDPVQFLHIGNLTPVKDQETLLRAFRIISDSISAELTIIGEGPLSTRLRVLTNQLLLDGKVTFISTMPYEQLPAYYHRSDILLHTSLSEAHVMVVAEAMASGVVVCGTNVGLLYDLPDCCVSVPVREFRSLAKETLSLLSDRARYSMVRTKAWTWTQEHPISRTACKISECYRNA